MRRIRPGAVLMVCASCVAVGQESPPAPVQPQGDTRAVRIEDLPPAVRLGARAELVRRSWPVIPVLVVVPDTDSYLHALRGWSLKGRFPVLIDDGSAEAREDIARFARGFQPRQIVRWRHEGEPEADRRSAVEQTLFRVWSMKMPGEEQEPVIDTQAHLVARWKQIRVDSPGIIAADPADPAWTAAVALAVGRAQPIAWVSGERNVNGVIAMERLDALAAAIEKAAEETGLTWRELGDEIDSLTLALNLPAKVQPGSGDVLAATDVLARHAGEDGRASGARWAWCGQIFGDEARAAYSAMCSLFLAQSSAWLFDSYPATEPWNHYDVTEAGRRLTEGFDLNPQFAPRFTATVDDGPEATAQQWRRRASKAVEAGLIMVNTKGAADEFNLDHGRCRPGDVPFLSVPSAVYFVHSFSAAMPAERTTVGARWIERGAYAYCGSVHEPYLTAFVPTPAVASRVVTLFPWGAAVRHDSPAWKIATFGDPLLTFGPPAGRTSDPLPLADARDLQAELAEAVSARRFAEAITALSLLGRDADAAKLSAAVARDQPGAFTVQVAHASVLPAFRAGDLPTIIAAMEKLSPEQATGPQRDALWLAAWPVMSTLDKRSLDVLARHIREDQVGRDAADLARGIHASAGVKETADFLIGARERAKNDYDRQDIQQALLRYNIRR
jgi:hypothetical protein